MKGYYLSADSGSIPAPFSSSLTKDQLRESASMVNASVQPSKSVGFFAHCSTSCKVYECKTTFFRQRTFLCSENEGVSICQLH